MSRTSEANNPASVSEASEIRILKGNPTDADIAAAPAQLAGKTEQDALIAYLQGLGIQIKARR